MRVEATPQIEQHLSANMNMSKKDIIVGNFLGGIAWGIGTVIGAGVVVAIVVYILSSLGIFQAIGSIFEPLNELKNLNQTLPQFSR